MIKLYAALEWTRLENTKNPQDESSYQINACATIINQLYLKPWDRDLLLVYGMPHI